MNHNNCTPRSTPENDQSEYYSRVLAKGLSLSVSLAHINVAMLAAQRVGLDMIDKLRETHRAILTEVLDWVNELNTIDSADPMPRELATIVITMNHASKIAGLEVNQEMQRKAMRNVYENMIRSSFV